MSVGDVAGLIAAIAFVALVGFLALPLIKLGKVFDQTSASLREVTGHTVPVIDETAAAIASTNVQLSKVDTITTSAAEVSENLSALSTLFAATLGGPLVKVAAFSYGVRRALGNIGGRGTHERSGSGGRPGSGRESGAGPRADDAR